MPRRWKLQCDRSGFDMYNDEAVTEWIGLVVRRDMVDQRHPQEFVRARRDRQSVPNPRPESPDVFQSPGLWWFTDYDQSGEILTIGL